MIRVIRTSARRSHGEVADLIQGLLVLEIMVPSSAIYLVSAWITDIAVISNGDGAFLGLDPDLPQRDIRLSEALVLLASRGTSVFVATNEDPHNLAFLQALKRQSVEHGCRDAVRMRVIEQLHAKGLVTDAFHLNGSMNFTYNGINILSEEISVTTDSNAVSRARISYHDLYFSGEVT